MAPSHSRQLLVWTLPTIAVLLSYLWYKKKRIGAQSDPGDRTSLQSTEEARVQSVQIKDTDEIDAGTKSSPAQLTPSKSFTRSLSGVETIPIDIIIPRELRSVKSTPVVITDEDLDIEIEKVKSMKSSNFDLYKSKTANNSPTKSKTPSPKFENTPFKCKKAKNKGKHPPPNMAQKDIAVVEEKLTSLKIDSKSSKKNMDKSNKSQENNNVSTDREDLQRQSSERDSANHSPADVMLASPSLSSISDNHSEGSNDSGKGGSDVATPPPSRTPGTDGSISGDINLPIVYEFIIPQTYVGKLIGKHGNFVSQINDKSNAQILVKKHPTNNKLKVCAVEGNQNEIEKALKMIRDKFPLKRYTEVTLEQVSFLPQISTIPLIPDHLYLKLVEGINNDTIVSCMVTPMHLFLQQPTHPTFPNLNILSNYMNICYTDVDSPLLPDPVPENTICAAFSVDAWYRAMILATDDETKTSYCKFLDFGGYAYVENSQLRQIRGDFMLLPFQAAECLLANVKAVGGDEIQWAEEAYNLVAEQTKGALIYTQVIDYSDDGIPLVHCYVVISPQHMIFLNQELVSNGFAEWVSYEDDEQQEGAVGGVVA